MNLNVGPVCTYFITYVLHMLRKQAAFWESIYENLLFPKSCTEAALITDELHEKLISFASHVYETY